MKHKKHLRKQNDGSSLSGGGAGGAGCSNDKDSSDYGDNDADDDQEDGGRQEKELDVNQSDDLTTAGRNALHAEGKFMANKNPINSVSRHG